MGSCYSHWMDAATPSHISSTPQRQHNQLPDRQTIPSGTITTSDKQSLDSGFKSACPGGSSDHGSTVILKSPIISPFNQSPIVFKENAQQLQTRLGELDSSEMEREFSRRRRDVATKENQPMSGYPPKKVEMLSALSDGIIYSSESTIAFLLNSPHNSILLKV